MQVLKKESWQICFLLVLAFILTLSSGVNAADLEAPEITNTPRLDTIVTNERPLLSIFNSPAGGEGPRNYIFQIDTSPDFDSPDLIEYRVPETPGEEGKYYSEPRVTSKRVEPGDELEDGKVYYWRARLVDAEGKMSPWGSEAGGIVPRFQVDLGSNDSFAEVVRTPIKEIYSSHGMGSDNIIPAMIPGDYWKGYSSQNEYWVKIELEEKEEVTKIWQLSQRTQLSGRLKDYVWQYSTDGETWKEIEETRVEGSDAFRSVKDIDTVEARFLRLLISDWHGPVPKINEIALYSPGMPEVPEAPSSPYVLVVGNQFDGTGYGNIVPMVDGAGLGLETLVVPYYEVNPQMIAELDKEPTAIILSGFSRWYENIPMFEFNGEFELIRDEEDIPILGICGGHQLMVMAHGYTFARDMGRGIYTHELHDLDDLYPVSIEKEDPIFDGLPDPFYAAEFHGWDVVIIPENYKVLGVSDWMGNEIIRDRERMVYGMQYHGEHNLPFNVGRMTKINFLRMAVDK